MEEDADLPRDVFWAEGLAGWDVGGEQALDAGESRHAAVLRLAPGERIGLLDGRGALGRAEVLAGRGPLRLRLLSLERAPGPPSLALACPAPKGWRLVYLAEKLQELGLRTWHPLACERGERRSAALDAERLAPRLRQACKQSGCPWLMEIGPPLVAAQACRLPGAVVLDKEGRPPATIPPPAGAGLLVLAGPEGGWAPEERAAFTSAGTPLVRLGRHDLRLETAALLGTARLMELLAP